jgi:hypothetical protein
MNSIIPFQNKIRDLMTEGKCNPRKSRHSQHNSQIRIRNTDKNEKDKNFF